MSKIFFSLKKTYSSQNLLKNILVALSNTDSQVGYVQGMNILVSSFLGMKVAEDESYWLSKYIFKKMKLKDVMINNFPKLNSLNYQLENFMMNYMPDVLSHLVLYLSSHNINNLIL